VSTLIVKHGWSDAYRSAQFVATGQMPPVTTETIFEAATLTAEQRAAWAEAVGVAEKVTVYAPGTRDYNNKLALYDAPLTIEDAISGVRRQQDEWFSRDAAELTHRRDEGIAKLRQALEAHNPREGNYVTEADVTQAEQLGVDISEWRGLTRQYRDAAPTFWQEEREREAAKQERIEAQREAERAEKAAAAAAFAAEKQAWVAAHGSDYLKRACGGGYDCARLYVTERAAQEAPGYVVDFDDVAEWKGRSCPSLAALDLEADARKRGVGETQIVWLTSPVRAKRPHEDEDYYEYEDDFEPCEAVAIRKYLGKYDLVRLV